ncbi:MAG: hydrolase, family protein [Phycisphaerales bacterium]|nr:hydrolase, family protein [Phycisphaerales bacterium]
MKIRYDMACCFVVRPGEQAGQAEFLQLRRSPGEYLAGAWSTVRGRIEDGEKAWEAALRELHEEAGIVPDEFYQLDTVDIFYLHGDDTLWHCPGFCAVVKGDVRVTLNEEHDAWRWTARDEIDRKFIWPGERAQLAELCREVLDNGPAKAYLRIEVPKKEPGARSQKPG